MELTKKRAIELSIELWEWLLETGEEKADWPGWEKYGTMMFECPLCEYARTTTEHKKECAKKCPYYIAFGSCLRNRAPFKKWQHCDGVSDRKKYASLFLAQLRELT